MSFVDFEELKSRVNIEDAADFLGIEMSVRGNQLRSSCPHCGGGDRTLAITPSRNAFYCFAWKRGGDCIALVAHVLDIQPKEAAAKLWERYCTITGTVPERRKGTVPEERRSNQTKKLEPLSDLQFDHEAVLVNNLNPKVAERFGIGFREKHSGAGSVLIPIRDEHGELHGYLGVQELTYVPKDFQMPENVIPMRKQSA